MNYVQVVGPLICDAQFRERKNGTKFGVCTLILRGGRYNRTIVDVIVDARKLPVIRALGFKGAIMGVHGRLQSFRLKEERDYLDARIIAEYLYFWYVNATPEVEILQAELKESMRITDQTERIMWRLDDAFAGIPKEWWTENEYEAD